MLKTIEQKTSNNTVTGSSRQEARPETVVIEAQRYLDFTYGKMAIDIRLPDGETATLIIGRQGRAFLQFTDQE